jgi:hypothetical protein
LDATFIAVHFKNKIHVLKEKTERILHAQLKAGGNNAPFKKGY